MTETDEREEREMVVTLGECVLCGEATDGRAASPHGSDSYFPGVELTGSFVAVAHFACGEQAGWELA